MPTILKFPQDLLRFLYWVFFKPITLENYLRGIDPSVEINTSLITLWRLGTTKPRLRTLVWLSLFHILITPWLLSFPVAGFFALLGYDVNWVGVAGGVAGGVVGGVAVGVAGGVAGGVSFLICYFRLFTYVLELPISLLVTSLAVRGKGKKNAIKLFKYSPLNWDELIWLPLLGLDQHLVAIGKNKRADAQRAIADVTQSFRQQWAARNALIELTAYDVERAQNAQAIANIADEFAWLPPAMPKELENVLPPIREIAQYAQAALESDTLYNKQTQLRNAIAQTQSVRQGFALGRSRQIASRFGRALETWEQVFERELAVLGKEEIVPNVYARVRRLQQIARFSRGGTIFSLRSNVNYRARRNSAPHSCSLARGAAAKRPRSSKCPYAWVRRSFPSRLICSPRQRQKMSVACSLISRIKSKRTRSRTAACNCPRSFAKNCAAIRT